MSNKLRTSKIDVLYTMNNNIKCLSLLKVNLFKIRNNKIYFENNEIDQLNTTQIGMYVGNFNFNSSDSALIYGINNLNNTIIENGLGFVKTKIIDGVSIKFYRTNLNIKINSNVGNTKFYVLDSNDKSYEIPLIFNGNCKRSNCNKSVYQSYGRIQLGKEVPVYTLNTLTSQLICSKSNVYRLRKLNHQQNLYAMMRRYPEKFPIISSVKNMNLTLAQQIQYSNMWWRQFGTSQALPVNGNFGGFFLPGSDTPFVN